MEIKRTDLLEALAIVKPGLASKELIEQATSFAFLKNRVATYNDAISISHPINMDLEGAINAEKLYSFLSKIKKDEITLEIKDTELHITCGRATAGFALKNEIILPFENIQIKKWHDLPENFLKYMSFAMGACSRDMSQPLLTCINVDASGYIEASDGKRIIQCTLQSEMPIKTFLIPANSIVDVLKIKPTKIAEQKGWVHFLSEEGTIISCRIFEKDVFVNIRPHLQVKGTSFTFPQSIEDVLERASVFTKKDHVLDEVIDITIKDKRLAVQANAITGWFEEKINISYDGEPLTFGIAPYLLRDILRETFKCVISKEKIKFEGSGWLYVAVLKAA